MMRMNNINRQTVVKKDNLLKTLRENHEKHSKIVDEARKGYVEQAKEAITKRLEQLKEGKIVSLTFHLNPPLDYSEVYRTTIKMLEWTTEDKLTLAADEFRQLVLDEWSWTESFYGSNKRFSATASQIAAANNW